MSAVRGIDEKLARKKRGGAGRKWWCRLDQQGGATVSFDSMSSSSPHGDRYFATLTRPAPRERRQT